MLYGFLGFQPTVGGFKIDPRLPSDWKELAITRIHIHDHVVDVRVHGSAIDVTDRAPAAAPLKIDHPPSWQVQVVK